MIVTKEIVQKARQLARNDYNTWGQYVIECYTNDELHEDLEEFHSLAKWIEIRKEVAAYHREIESSI